LLLEQVDPLFDDAYIPYDDGLATLKPLLLLALFPWLAPLEKERALS